MGARENWKYLGAGILVSDKTIRPCYRLGSLLPTRYTRMTIEALLTGTDGKHIFSD